MTFEERNEIENALMIVRGINGIMEEIRVADMTEAVENIIVFNLCEAERILRKVVSE